VALSVPCIAGPYTSVSCKLSLTGNRYRKTTSLSPQYREATGGNDPRFVYNVGSIQSIATSQAQNDGGLFTLDFRDERYLPFEGQGALGSWRLELPKVFPQFDHASIADVVLHVRYTARDAGKAFRDTVENGLKQELTNLGLVAAFDVRAQLPNEWFRLLQSGSAQINFSKELLPFYMQGHSPVVQKATWLARVAKNPGTHPMTLNGVGFSLQQDTALGNLCKGDSPGLTLGTPFTLGSPNAAALEGLVVILSLGIS